MFGASTVTDTVWLPTGVANDPPETGPMPTFAVPEASGSNATVLYDSFTPNTTLTGFTVPTAGASFDRVTVTVPTPGRSTWLNCGACVEGFNVIDWMLMLLGSESVVVEMVAGPTVKPERTSVTVAVPAS
jgi:hypothetical protein